MSSYPDNDLSQGEETRDEVLLSVDEISDLLAHDFERYANQSKDACVLTRYANSCGKVNSPKFDVEEDVVSECAMSSVGGVCDSNLYISTRDDYHVKNAGIRVVADSRFSCFHEDEIHSDSSYDKKSNTNEIVYPSELFEKEFDTDHHIVNTQFHDNSYDLGSNNLFKYEENATYV